MKVVQVLALAAASSALTQRETGFLRDEDEAEPLKTFQEIRQENLINRWKRRFDNLEPDIDKEMAYKIRNYQKTFWALKDLEKRVAEKDKDGYWDPKLEHWTNWDPQWDTDRKNLNTLREDLKHWKEEIGDIAE